MVGFAGTSVPLEMTLSPLGSRLAAGQTVATVRVSSDQDTGATGVPAVAQSSLPSPTWSWRLSHIF
jgi:hypothetical protein